MSVTITMFHPVLSATISNSSLVLKDLLLVVTLHATTSNFTFSLSWLHSCYANEEDNWIEDDQLDRDSHLV